MLLKANGDKQAQTRDADSGLFSNWKCDFKIVKKVGGGSCLGTHVRIKDFKIKKKKRLLRIVTGLLKRNELCPHHSK